MISPSTPSFTSIDDAHRWLLSELVSSGAVASPRGRETKELLGVTFSVREPRRRCLLATGRRWSLPLAIGEFCWHVSASSDLSSIAYYAPAWREFSEDNFSISGSCYGKRVFGRVNNGPSQWDRLLRLLQDDLTSRRAVLSFQEQPNQALNATAKDVACATSLQFFVREGRVHAVAYMRSNDIIWGMPYDVFLFTMIQEMLATTLGLELGVYVHVAGSLHLYSRHYHLAGKMLDSPASESWSMPAMKSLEQLPLFLETEKNIRSGAVYDGRLKGYWGDLAAILAVFSRRKHPNLPEANWVASESPYSRFVGGMSDGDG